ncbi:MAG: Lrp/AsnC ligand binding domain-containing protein [Candidatus Methylomirabilales bacterium]
MTTQAYVFVYIAPGRAEGVAKEIAQLEGVRSAHMCWGRPDVIAFTEVATPTDLSQLVLRRIHRIGGVEATDTRIVVEA